MNENIRAINEWTFPFKTCEVPLYTLQPFSFIINLLSVYNMYRFYKKSTFYSIKLTIFFYLFFELFHTLSHAYRFDASTQTFLIHFIAYTFFTSTWFSFSLLTNHILNIAEIFFINCLVLIDLNIFYFVGGLWTVITGLTLFASLFIFYYRHLPSFFQYNLKYKLIPGLIIILLLFFNEAINCDYMLKYQILPYHAIIEIIGLYLFHILSQSFYIWNNLLIKNH